MLNTQKTTLVALNGLLLLGAVSAAHANTQSFSSVLGSAAVPFTTSFSLPLFDPTIGTLTGVRIDFTNNVVGQVQIRNFDSVTHNYSNVGAQIPVTLTNPDSSTFAVTATTSPLHSGSIAGGNTAVTFIGDPGTNSGFLNVGVGNFSFYQGAAGSFGNYSAVGSSTTTGTSDGGLNVGFSSGGSASGTAQVTYTFAPVVGTPEPGTWGLLMAGGSTGLVLLRRRRRK